MAKNKRTVIFTPKSDDSMEIVVEYKGKRSGTYLMDRTVDFDFLQWVVNEWCSLWEDE